MTAFTETHHTIAKYITLILSWFGMVASAIMLLLCIIGSFKATGDQTAVFVVGTIVYLLVPLYLYFVPIRGVNTENATLLMIHGFLTLLATILGIGSLFHGNDVGHAIGGVIGSILSAVAAFVLFKAIKDSERQGGRPNA